MNENKVLLETEFEDSLMDGGRFYVKIIDHESNVVLGECVEVKIEHSEDAELNFFETFEKENFPHNFYAALPNDWDFVSEKIKDLLGA